MLLTLSKALQAELIHVFRNMRLPDRDGNIRPIQVHRQRFPKQKKLARADASTDPIPACLVIWDRMEESKKEDTEVAAFLLDFALYDDGAERDGTDGLMILIDLIRERFGKDQYLGIYRKCAPLISAPQVEDTGDYFVSGVIIKFEVPMYVGDSDKEGSDYEQWQQQNNPRPQLPPRRRTP